MRYLLCIFLSWAVVSFYRIPLSLLLSAILLSITSAFAHPRICVRSIRLFPLKKFTPMKPQPGSIKAIYDNQKNSPLFAGAVLQIISVTLVPHDDGSKHRYKVSLSDGVHHMKSLFSSCLAHLFDEQRLRKNCLVKVNEIELVRRDSGCYIHVRSVFECGPEVPMIGSPVNIVTGRSSIGTSTEQPFAAPAAPQHTTFSKPNSPVSVKRAIENPSNGKKQKNPKNPNEGVFIDIKDINPFQHNWIVKGRVVSKSDVKKFTSAKGEGKLFSFELADRSSQVKCVAFSDCVDIFFPLVELNSLLTISRATIKVANKKFSSGNLDYEIMLEKNSIVEMVEEDGETPKYLFNFTKIKDLAVGTAVVDAVGVIKEVFPASTIVTKSTGKELDKRDIIVVDETGHCRLTIWGQKANDTYEPDTIIAMKGVKVGEYNGINLSTVGSSQILLNCEIPEAIQLMAWYQREGRDMVLERPKKTPKITLISELKDGHTDYGTTKATIMFIKDESLYYEACPSDGCNKKVSMESNGTYRCERCNYTYPNCNYRYMFSMHIGDMTGQIWASIFNESGNRLFGMPAEELKNMSTESPQEVHSLVKDLISKEFVFSLRGRDDEYNGELRRKFTVNDASPVDFVTETRRMLDAIEKCL